MWRRAAFAVVAALVASTAAAGWPEVSHADARFDLEGARRAALDTVSAAPDSADAIAAAGWWLHNVDVISEPEALLSAVPDERDPELGFLLARLEAELARRPPAGVPASFELAGPFGVFDTLDIERGVVPPDPGLPPPGTRFVDDAQPFRLRFTTLDGSAKPPRGMVFGGVYLAAWDLVVDQPLTGWLVLEVEGGANLELDGRPVERIRRAGETTSGVCWYRIELRPGSHRVGVEMASTDVPQARISLWDDHGRPVNARIAESPVTSPAGSTARRAEPPAAAALEARLAGGGADLPTLLLGVAVARGRDDPRHASELMARALELAPDDPSANLTAALLLLEEPSGLASEVAARRAREHLRRAAEIPLSLLAERALAVREQRAEDVDRLLNDMVDRYGSDARVLSLWVREAVRRGWVREAEAALERLAAMLPGSRRVAEMRVEVAQGLERWDERTRLLRALAEGEPEDLNRVDDLAGACLVGDAVEILERLRGRAEDPTVDLDAARRQLEAGRTAEASASLTAARQRWGELQALDELELALAAANADTLRATVEHVLARHPSNLQLAALDWRLGATPFYAPFVVDGLELARQHSDSPAGVDAELLLDQAVERIFPDGSSLHYYHGLTRAVTPDGARQAASLQQLPGSLRLKVRVVKPDGTIVVPPELTPDDDVYQLADVEPGDLVEEEYVARIAPTGASRRGHLSPYIYRFADADRAFGLSEYALLVPPGVDPKVEGRFVGLERKEWDQDGLHVVRWRAEKVPPIPREPFSPPVQELLPWVTYGFGVSWQDVGDVLRDRFLEVLETTPELEAWSAPLVAGDDPQVAAQRLAEGLEKAVKEGRESIDLRSTAGESFSRGEGNRIVIAAAALLAGGWDVDLVMARPRVFAGTHLAVPSMEAFSTPLLRLSRGGRSAWYDVEEGRRGAGRVRPLVQGSDALAAPLARPELPVERIERLPEFPNPELEERVLARAVIDADGTAHVHFELELPGGQGQRLEETVRSQPPDRVAQVYRQIAVGLFPGAEQVEGRVDHLDDDAIRLVLDLVSAGACEVAERTMTCRSLVLAKPLGPSLASLPERTFPLVLHLPILQRLELVVSPPAGWKPVANPRVLSAQWGSVDETVGVGSDGLHSVVTLDIPAQTVAPADYPEFARFCHAVDELLARPPMLERLPR